ncbi:FHA domain-containing protein [Agromyces salentinus]|uniref:FHA domain-containing protein n=1 Tax=Agromyces salentinus TaxID=269421 RepID=A0ABP4ZA36_9MICO|nr:FHA domain-containing protein [Agromyces salentinus]
MVRGTVTSASHDGRLVWDVVIGDRFIAALAAPADDRAISALAEAASDPDVEVERLVEKVPAPSTDPDRGFAIVWWPDDGTETVTAVVRGSAVVDLESPGGSRRFDARGVRPWHLAEFRDVIGVRVAGAEAPLDRLGTATERVRHARASLRATTIEWVAASESAQFAEASEAEAAVEDGDTVLRGVRPVRWTPDAAGGSARPGHGPGAATVPLSARDLRAEDAPAGEADAGTDLPRRQPPAAVPMVRIAGGEPRIVAAPILIGRRPRAPRTPFSRSGMPELVAVRSPTGIVSGTHLELRAEGSRLVATDLQSTNGTLLRTPVGVRRLRAGESIVVAEGSSLDLGDGTIVEVLPVREGAASPNRDDRPST